MTAAEIITKIARDKGVEALAEKVCRRPAAEVPDLVQLVYLALLETAEGRVLELYETGALNFYIVRILRNQYYSRKSAFYRQVKGFADRSVSLKEEVEL